LEPGDALPGLEGDAVVERVAVRDQEVEIAVAVEVRRREVRRAPVRVRGAPDDALAVAPRRRREDRHLLALLRDGGGEAGECEVRRTGGWGGRGRAGGRHEGADAGLRAHPLAREGEGPAGRRLVAQDEDAAALQPAEGAHHDVEVAVAVEVDRLRVRDAAD